MGLATPVAVLEEPAVSTDNGIVDVRGRTVGSGSESIVVEIIKTAVEVTMGSKVDEPAAEIIGLSEEEGMMVLAFAVSVVGGCTMEVVRPISEELHTVDMVAVASPSPPSPPATMPEGFELVNAKALGQSPATASPENIIPINVSGNAFVPLQALLTMIVRSLRKLIQSREQAWPSAKSDDVQAVNGVSYASVQTFEKPATC